MESPLSDRLKSSATALRATHRNFKTQLRNKSKFGHCSYGGRCHSAYDYGEMNLNYRLLNGQGHASRGDKLGRTFGNDPKLKICRFFSSGKDCRYGYKCQFMHVRPENSGEASRESRDHSASKNIDIDFKRQNHSGCDRLDAECDAYMSYDSRLRAKTMGFGRNICYRSERNGDCSYGDSYYFAHGQAAHETWPNRMRSPVAISEYRMMTIPSLSSYTRKSTSIPGKGIGHSLEKQQHRVTPVVMWNKKRINCIYADWIEDVPHLPQSLH